MLGLGTGRGRLLAHAQQASLGVDHRHAVQPRATSSSIASATGSPACRNTVQGVITSRTVVRSNSCSAAAPSRRPRRTARSRRPRSSRPSFLALSRPGSRRSINCSAPTGGFAAGDADAHGYRADGFAELELTGRERLAAAFGPFGRRRFVGPAAASRRTGAVAQTAEHFRSDPQAVRAPGQSLQQRIGRGAAVLPIDASKEVDVEHQARPARRRSVVFRRADAANGRWPNDLASRSSESTRLCWLTRRSYSSTRAAEPHPGDVARRRPPA